MNAPDTVASTNPFPGLRPFHEDEEHLFFGREKQVDAMIDKLAETHFLAVVGKSGSGKSSLVNCGLRPALHRGWLPKAGTVWRIAQFRPGSNPIRTMAEALARHGVLYNGFESEDFSLAEIIESGLRTSKLGLITAFEQARLGADVNLLVVADQFEELFRYHKVGASGSETAYELGEEAKAFVSLLLEVCEHTSLPVYVVLTMRSDFLGDCAQFFGLPEAINEGQYLVPRMSRDERRLAIVGPVGVGGAQIDPALATRLVNDVGDNPDQLSILQHALNRTWARWENQDVRQGPLELKHYEAIGTMAHALDQHAERAFAELDTERKQKICERIMKALTDWGTDARGTRRPTKLGTLCALAEATEAEVTDVIDVFRKPSRSFLMPPAQETLDEERVIDVSHESLMRVWERLKTWGEEEAGSAQMYRRMRDWALRWDKGDADLWRGPDLASAIAWREREAPRPQWAERYGGRDELQLAMRFLDASKQAQRGDLPAFDQAQRRDLPAFDEVHVISDIHMGGKPGFQILRETNRLANFIRWVATQRPDGRVALVLNGDVFDTLAEDIRGYVAVDEAVSTVQRIMDDASFSQIWNALGEFVQKDGRTLVVVIGNHDIEVAFPPVQRLILSRLAGDNLRPGPASSSPRQALATRVRSATHASIAYTATKSTRGITTATRISPRSRAA